MADKQDKASEAQPKDTKSVPVVRLRNIKAEFDQRNLLDLEPLDSKHGIVRVEYTDGTYNAKACTRGSFERVLVELINTKLEVTT